MDTIERDKMSERALRVLRKYENRPTGYDEWEITQAMIEFYENESKLKAK